MSGITEFLLARIAEDACRLFDNDGAHIATCLEVARYAIADRSCTCGLTAQLEADCASKRQIIWFSSKQEDWFPGENAEQVVGQVLRYLAQPYRDHPDFDPAWGPAA